LGIGIGIAIAAIAALSIFMDESITIVADLAACVSITAGAAAGGSLGGVAGGCCEAGMRAATATMAKPAIPAAIVTRERRLG
jgi:hypothetical protein